MKSKTPFSLAAGLLACALPLATAWPANPPVLRQPSDQAQQQQPEVKTFSGKISKNGQKLVLEDASMNTAYQLDDQKRASQYVGKTVRVTGTLDAENNLIHVQTIEEAV